MNIELANKAPVACSL